MIYRQAQPADAFSIALLHADSWRRTYRGLFSDDFLDHQADDDRLKTWNQRLGNNPANQLVYVAEDAGEIKGFACAYGNDHARWGSLIDNLHVASACKRQGVGSALMAHVFAWLAEHFPDYAVYLWVMQHNLPAIQFYEKLGETSAELFDKPNPVGGGSAPNYRYVWPEAKTLNSHAQQTGNI